MIRLLCAGLGGMGRHDWSSAAKVSDFRLVAGVDVDAKARAFFTEKTGSPTFSDFAAALAKVRADAALVATPDAFHAPYTIQALEAGLDVICEKPMAETLADAERMHATAEQQHRMLMIHHQLRWAPPFYQARQLIAAGEIGTLRQLDFDMFVHSDVCLRGYRSKLQHLMLRDLAIHHFDLMRYLSGQEVRSVYARSWAANEEQAPIPTTTAVHAVLELAGPVTVSYRSGMRDILEQTGYGCRFKITGSKGSLGMADGHLRLQTHVGHAEGVPVREIVPEKSPACDPWQAFATAMRTRRPTLTSSADNLRSLAVMFAAIESAERGKVVRL